MLIIRRVRSGADLLASVARSMRWYAASGVCQNNDVDVNVASRVALRRLEMREIGIESAQEKECEVSQLAVLKAWTLRFRFGVLRYSLVRFDLWTIGLVRSRAMFLTCSCHAQTFLYGTQSNSTMI